MLRHVSRFFGAVLVLAGCGVLAVACGRQAEGEACNATVNGNDDCADGFECVGTKKICCPKDRATSSVTACRDGVVGDVGVDSNLPPDTAAADSAPADTGVDGAAGDTGTGTADTRSDAATDAAADSVDSAEVG